MADTWVIRRYVRARALDSKLIEWDGGSNVSHAATVMPDGRIIDSRSDICGGARPGVQWRDGDYLDGSPYIDIALPCTWMQAARIYNLLESQLGKPYDKLGILTFLTGSMRDRNWRDQRAWFCDELVLWTDEESERIPRLIFPVYRYNPGASLGVEIGAGAFPVHKNLWPEFRV